MRHCWTPTIPPPQYLAEDEDTTPSPVSGQKRRELRELADALDAVKRAALNAGEWAFAASMQDYRDKYRKEAAL